MEYSLSIKKKYRENLRAHQKMDTLRIRHVHDNKEKGSITGIGGGGNVHVYSLKNSTIRNSHITSIHSKDSWCSWGFFPDLVKW